MSKKGSKQSSDTMMTTTARTATTTNHTKVCFLVTVLFVYLCIQGLVLTETLTSTTYDDQRSIVSAMLLAASTSSMDELWSSAFGMQQQQAEQSNDDDDDEETIPRTKNNSNSGSSIRICPSVWNKFYEKTDENRQALIQLWHDAHAYHNLGGNLQALQTFLDKSIDTTYDKLGLTPFQVDNGDGSNNNNQHDASSPTSTRQTILDELRKRDTQNRGGYYQRKLPGTFQGPGSLNKVITTSEQRHLTSVWQPDSVERWDIAMGPTLVHKPCQGFHVIQGPPQRRYEDKYICGWDTHYLQNKTTTSTTQLDEKNNDDNNNSPPCHVISVGSNDQWGFETSVIQSTNCQIATFDCTIVNPRHKPPTNQVKFYSQCISDTQGTVNGRSFATYFDLLDTANFTKNGGSGDDDDDDSSSASIQYLKMDVEGYEYSVLTKMIAQASTMGLKHLLPEQMQLEFHYSTWMFDLPWSLRKREAGELVAFFSMLFREGGYVAVHVDRIENIASLQEVLLLKVFC